ncbi:PepSY-associated TM helix domain-containing protein [Campylobacter fetus]|uniref:PepSY-associated TM helix domain-containing protein n=1 Tax=Campylobacter fetus TaxID=196 RepID=UPI00118D48A5|nr:PepSY-associated TM helix domain-containing protein [Campylobacter fetus]QDS05138.1 PepSY domain-containing protein [Campylobacter fetus subsp. fetus]
MRKIFYRIHKYLAIIFFIPLIVIGFSGSVLVYKTEFDNLIMPNVVSVTPGGQRVKFDDMTRNINNTYINHEIVGWLINTDNTKSDRVYLIEHNDTQWKSIYIDQYTGKIMDKLKPHDSYLSDIILEIHDNLLLEQNGRIMVGILGLIMFFIGFSGFVIYNRFWINLFKLRFKNIAVAMTDIHKFIGVWASALLFIIGLTGSWWALNFLFKQAGQIDENFRINEKIYNKNLSIDELFEKSQIDFDGFIPYYISYPFYIDRNITFYGMNKNQNFLHHQYSNQVSYDKQSGKLIEIKNIENAKISDRFLSTFRKAHFGYYNEVTKFIWFLVGLTPFMLSITGIYLWLKRKK